MIVLNQKTSLSKNKVGGKAANLNKLFRSGFVIPTAFALSTSVFESFAKEAKVFSKILDLTLDKSLDDLISDTAEIQKIILSCNISPDLLSKVKKTLNKANIPLLAVRSSVNVEDGSKFSFAGQFESFLDVNLEEIESSIKKCWASCYSGRVIMYCYYNKISPSILRPSVILQEMLSAKKGGVVFTRSPKPNQALIEVCNGDVNHLTDGVVEPERYYINQQNKIDVIVGGSHSNTSQERLRSVVDVAREIEHTFGCPQDIEWIFHHDQVIILQARPQTS